MTDLEKLVEQWCEECGFASWSEWPEYSDSWEKFGRLAMAHAASECIGIVYGQCDSDNAAQRTADAIRKQFGLPK